MLAFVLRFRWLVLTLLVVTPGCRCNRVPEGAVVLVREGSPLHDNVRRIAGADEHVYYVEGEHGLGWRLKRIPKAGGPMFQLAEVQKAIVAILPAGETTYFATDGAVYRVPSRGGPASRILEAKEVCQGGTGCGLAASQDQLFVTTQAGILRIGTLGAEPREIASGLTGPADSVVALAVDATHVYWLHQVKDGLFRAPRAGGPVETVATGLPMGRDPTLVVSGGSAFYLAGNELFRVPVTGGAPESIAATGSHTGSYSGSFAVAGELVYFTRATAYIGAGTKRAPGARTSQGEGGVMKVPVSGGAPVWVAHGVDQVYSLHVDTAAVYFATDDGQLIKHPL